MKIYKLLIKLKIQIILNYLIYHASKIINLLQRFQYFFYKIYTLALMKKLKNYFNLKLKIKFRHNNKIKKIN